MARQSSAGVQPHALLLPHVVWQNQAPARIKQLPPIAGPVRGFLMAGHHCQKGCSLTKTVALLALGGQQRGEFPRNRFAVRAGRGVGVSQPLVVRCRRYGVAVGAVRAHLPFGNADQAQAQGALTAVGQPHTNLLYRQCAIHAPGGIGHEIAAPMTDNAVALPVGHAVIQRGLATDARRQAPDLAGLAVLDKKPFCRRVCNRIVGPGCQLVQAAVLRPGIPATRL